jgi:hypothetical protein
MEEKIMSLKEVATLLVLSMLLLSFTPINIQSQTLHYSEVVSSWLDWIMELDIYTPSILVLGSIANINISLILLEKGLGLQLCITSVSISLAGISVSRYVGFLRSGGDTAFVTISIPLSNLAYPQYKPGSTIRDNLQIILQGYIEFANGSRKTMFFTKVIPVNIYVPPSNVITYIDCSYATNGIQLIVTLRNFDVNPAYNVYLSLYVNSSQYYIQYYDLLYPQSQNTFSRFLALDPGLYYITAIVNYTTAYGISRSFSASTIVIVPTTPRIYIKANATELISGQKVSIEGSVEPRTSLDLVLEYSLNGFDWISITYLETARNGSLHYIWRPGLTGIIYVRGRTIETERFKEAISNVITIHIAKLKPNIRISADKTILTLGDNTKLTISVTPNTSIPVIIVYRRQEENEWRSYTTLTLDPNGKAIIPTPFFSNPGTYIFKALALETNFSTQSESNEVSITVQMPTSQMPTTPPQANTLKGNISALAITISISIAIAFLLFARGRRKS